MGWFLGAQSDRRDFCSGLKVADGMQTAKGSPIQPVGFEVLRTVEPASQNIIAKCRS